MPALPKPAPTTLAAPAPAPAPVAEAAVTAESLSKTIKGLQKKLKLVLQLEVRAVRQGGSKTWRSAACLWVRQAKTNVVALATASEGGGGQESVSQSVSLSLLVSQSGQ